ncbi:unnamed protein product [Boreogadus saida]
MSGCDATRHPAETRYGHYDNKSMQTRRSCGRLSCEALPFIGLVPEMEKGILGREEEVACHICMSAVHLNNTQRQFVCTLVQHRLSGDSDDIRRLRHFCNGEM